MNTSSFFLVIVPIRNNSFQAFSLVQSLIRQSFSDWRLLFVDASTSNLHIQALSTLCALDSRISSISQNSSSYGIYGAMNDGLSMLGNSKWVVFWGSDDFASSPDSLSAVHDIVIDHPNLDLACFRCNYIDDMGKIHNSAVISTLLLQGQ